MAEDPQNPEAARERLLDLIEADDWRFTDRARGEGQIALRWIHNRTPTDWEMIQYVAGRLRSDAPLRCVPQGDPPGSTGIAWQMTDERNIFIKLRIIEPRMGEPAALIVSLHDSVHSR